MPKTLAEKLYLRSGSAVVADAPVGYETLLGAPVEFRSAASLGGAFDWLLWFVAMRPDLESGIGRVKAALDDGAILWIAYPKAGQLGTDLNRDRLAELGRDHGLRAVTQVAIDDVWSTLRFK